MRSFLGITVGCRDCRSRGHVIWGSNVSCSARLFRHCAMFFLLSCETARQKFVHENSVRGPSTQATHTRREPLIAAQGPRIAQPVGPATVAPSHESELRCQIPQIACPSLGDALADVGTTALREQVRSFVDDCFKAEVAPSTVDRYQQILNATIKPAEKELAMRLLPLDSMKSFLALFGHLRLKRGAGCSGHTFAWSKQQSLSGIGAATPPEFSMNGLLRCVFFWSGFKRQCTHGGSGKDPVDFSELVQYLASVGKTRSASQASGMRRWQSPPSSAFDAARKL